MNATAPCTELRCRFPVPPSINRQYIHTRYGTRLHPAAEAFRDLAVLRMREVLAGEAWPRDAQYVLTVRVTFPNEKRPRDLDNCLKLLVDSLAAALGFNDKNVVEIHAYHMGYSKEHHGCDVLIEAIGALAPQQEHE